MATTIINSTNWTTKDTFNSRTSISLQDLTAEDVINVRGAAIAESPDVETGEIKRVGMLVSHDGAVYATISGTAIELVECIIDMLTDGEEVSVRTERRRSKQGREYLTLKLV